MEQMFTFDIGTAIHPGQKRAVNEDALWAPTDSQQPHERGALFMVADGMGAYGHGAVAAQKVIECVKDNYYLEGQPIQQAVEQANAQIYQFAQDHPENEGMGTTIVGVVCHPDGRFQAFNVGDSRAYLVRNGQIAQLSHDHSVVARRAEQEGISWADAAKRGKTNQLTRSIGRKPSVEVETKPVEQFGPGDAFLLCSDGLWRDVSNEELQKCIATADTAQDAATQLVNLSNRRGGADNITALVVRCVGHGAQKLTSMPVWATASFDTPPAPAKAASKTPAGKPNTRLIYSLMGLVVALAVIALILIPSLSGSPAPVATGVPVSGSTARATAAVITPTNTLTAIPTSSSSNYLSSLEIVSPNGGTQFYKRDAVVLKWKPPTDGMTLPTGQIYLVKISYVDLAGKPQTKSYPVTETLWRLPLNKFFAGETPLAKSGEYRWQVAVADANSSAVLSPWTEPPYSFQWLANPAILTPSATTIRVAQPETTPAPTTPAGTATPVCPPGKTFTEWGGCRDLSPQSPLPTP